MNILLIDNYDSFTYNLFQYIKEEGGADVNVTVWRNDQFELDDVEPFDKIILSPGPGVPDEAGLLKLSSAVMPLQSPYLACAWASKPLARCSAQRYTICPQSTMAYSRAYALSPPTTSSTTYPATRWSDAIILGR